MNNFTRSDILKNTHDPYICAMLELDEGSQEVILRQMNRIKNSVEHNMGLLSAAELIYKLGAWMVKNKVYVLED